MTVIFDKFLEFELDKMRLRNWLIRWIICYRFPAGSMVSCERKGKPPPSPSSVCRRKVTSCPSCGPYDVNSHPQWHNRKRAYVWVYGYGFETDPTWVVSLEWGRSFKWAFRRSENKSVTLCLGARKKMCRLANLPVVGPRALTSLKIRQQFLFSQQSSSPKLHP